jgi:diguanylate cyclase (GGDEF)-like protein
VTTTASSHGRLTSILVIGPEFAAKAVQGCCPQARPVRRVDDVLSGLEAIAAESVGAVFVWIGSLPARPAAALGGIRQLLRGDAKIFLIARPDEEPQALALIPRDADDYLIWPLRNDEVARALGAPGPGPAQPVTPGALFPLGAADSLAARVPADPASPDYGYAGQTKPPGVPGAEVTEAGSAVVTAESPAAGAGVVRLAEAIASAESDLAGCLDRVGVIVAEELHARGCTIELPDAISVCGEAIGEPVLAAGFDLADGRKGRLAVGPKRAGAYLPTDATALQGYAVLVGAVCRLALSASRWQREAQTDELTGLLNRRGLMLRLHDLLERARRQRTAVTLLIFDVDDLKHYNDTYGHNAGDEILRETGKLFVRHCRKQDLVARYGGDECVVVFWEADEPRVAGSKPPRDVLAVLNRLRSTLERKEFPSLGPGARGGLTISGGLITFPWDASSAEELIAKADEALLLAKRQGKNRIWLVGHGPQ